MDSSFYQRIWDADEEAFSVSGKNREGNWIDSSADILIDIQGSSSDKRHIDVAQNPLFHYVNPRRLETPLLTAFIALLNNYAINTKDPEFSSPAEEAEIDTFLDLVLASAPMSMAFGYISEHLARGITQADFRAQLRTMWFEPYTNHYQGKSTHFCSGFEHVFVGEGKFKERNAVDDVKGEISGYHSWIKFHLDEKHGRVDFRGYKYKNLAGQVPEEPIVITLQMIWNQIDLHGRHIAELFKKIGGFFVGRSPACEMALATLAYYEDLSKGLNNQRRRVQFGSTEFDLVLYRSTLASGRLGQHIRSFYPEVVAVNVRNMTQPDRTETHRVTHETNAPHLIRIKSAMINPVGSDEQGEWVMITNLSEQPVDLTGWELRDRLSRVQPLQGVLAATTDMTIPLRTTQAYGMQLKNQGGIITLHEPSGMLHHSVSYVASPEGEAVTFA